MLPRTDIPVNRYGACAYNLGGGLTASTYCAANAGNKLVVKLDASSADNFNYYHASTLGISILCHGSGAGGSGQCGRAAADFAVEEALFSEDSEENFDTADRRGAR